MAQETPARLDRAVVLALVAMFLAVFVIANDVSALAVALPDIEHDLDSDVDTVQWVINAYALVFGVFIVTAGRLADVFGRRRTFFLGAGIFAVFSLLGALAPSTTWLIVARALMGFGGAMILPSTLGMTYAALPRSRAGLAGGVVLGSAGLGNAAGPMLGGALTDLFGWRSVLLLNVPVAVVACLATWRFMAESRDPDAERAVDVPGVLTLSVGLVALLLALDQGNDLGWTSGQVLAFFAASAVLLALFVLVESRAGDRGLIPADVVANGQFRVICLAVLSSSAVFFAAIMYLPQFLQKILDWSALVAGTALLPMMGTFAVTSYFAGQFYERVGGKRVITAGAVALTVGSLLVVPVEASWGWVDLLPGMVFLGLGLGLFYSSATTAGVNVLGQARASLAGGLVYMCQIAGGSIGLALTTTLFTLGSSRAVEDAVSAGGPSLTSAEQDAVQGVLAGTESSQQVTDSLSSADATRVTDVVRDAFAEGMQWGFALVAVLAVLGLVLTVARVAGPPSVLLHSPRRGGGASSAGPGPEVAETPGGDETGG
jgi:EmrB/QacA subfamily drug resistance transporter